MDARSLVHIACGMPTGTTCDISYSINSPRCGAALPRKPPLHMKSFLRAAAATGVAAATISGVLPGTALAATPQDSETKPAVVAGTNGEFWGMTKSPGHTDFIQYDSYDAAVEASRSLAFPVGDWGRIRYDSTTCYGLWGNTSLLIGNNSCSSDSSLVRLDAHGELEVKSAPGLHLDGFSEYGGPQAHFGSGEDRYYFARLGAARRDRRCGHRGGDGDAQGRPGSEGRNGCRGHVHGQEQPVPDAQRESHGRILDEAAEGPRAREDHCAPRGLQRGRPHRGE